MSPKPYHSYHAFLFPFEWKRLGTAGQALIEEQTDLAAIRAVMSAARAQWQAAPTWEKPGTVAQYNEANYFYDFVRPALYGDPAGQYQVYYRHSTASGSEYVITVADDTEYRLELDDIGLSFYNMGVGVLTFHCYNRSHPNPADILRINQYGRRLFPPFYGSDLDTIGTQAFFEYADWSQGLDVVQARELARSIRLEKDGTAWATEDFARWRQKPVLDALPDLLGQILPRPLLRTLRFTPVLDDRMFVVCWYGHDAQIAQLKNLDLHTAPPEATDWWYQFVFVDAGYRTCRDDRMVQRLLDAHSNVRWQREGTLYGVSRYSFVCLTDSSAFSRLIASHVQTIYFKIAELALVQRACVLRFSDEVTAIGNIEKGDRHLAARAGSLTRQYLRFINKVYFREVTAQEQGIELYDLLQHQMRLDGHVKDLDKEIQELNQYVSLQEEDARNAKLDLLTYIGAFFVVPSFVCTYLSINEFDLPNHFGSVAVLCVLSALTFFGVIRTRGRWQQALIALAVLLMLYTLFVYPGGRF